MIQCLTFCSQWLSASPKQSNTKQASGASTTTKTICRLPTSQFIPFLSDYCPATPIDLFKFLFIAMLLYSTLLIYLPTLPKTDRSTISPSICFHYYLPNIGSNKRQQLRQHQSVSQSINNPQTVKQAVSQSVSRRGSQQSTK